jgi:hypothetical protein
MVSEHEFVAAVETIRQWMRQDGTCCTYVGVFSAAVYLDGKRFEDPERAWKGRDDGAIAERSLDEAGYPRAIR